MTATCLYYLAVKDFLLPLYSHFPKHTGNAGTNGTRDLVINRPKPPCDFIHRDRFFLLAADQGDFGARRIRLI